MVREIRAIPESAVRQAEQEASRESTTPIGHALYMEAFYSTALGTWPESDTRERIQALTRKAQALGDPVANWRRGPAQPAR